jgi:hypothetical protein
MAPDAFGFDVDSAKKKTPASWPAVRNLTAVAKALGLVALVTGLLAFLAFLWLWVQFPPSPQETLRVQYLAQYVAVVQVIAVGVVVTLVSVIIPLMLPEARDRFERYKESRQAYSRAKTAVIYLPDRVAHVDREKAFLLVEEAHREIHLAETFGDVIIEKGYLNWFGNPDLWLFYNYWQVVAVAEVLRKTDWSATNRDLLKQRLRDALAVVHRRFGTRGRGEKCKGEKWLLHDGSRFREEDLLEADIQSIVI